MRIGRSLGWLSLVAGVTTWLATRAALQSRERVRREEKDDRLRWETDGGATTGGPQTPCATNEQ